jgi:hypothetical protein
VACKKKPKAEGVDALKKRLEKNIADAEEVSVLVDLVKELMLDSSQKATNRLLHQLETSSSQSPSNNNIGPVVASVTAPINDGIDKHQSQNWSKPPNIDNLRRRLPPKCNGICRIEFLRSVKKQFVDEFGEDKSRISAASWKWYRRNVVTILGCVDGHFQGNTDAFLALYGQKFTVTMFKCKCPGHL